MVLHIILGLAVQKIHTIKYLQMLNGGHLGFMQIARVAQSCRLGNQSEFILGPHGSSNPQKNFMTLTISRFSPEHVDY